MPASPLALFNVIFFKTLYVNNCEEKELHQLRKSTFINRENIDNCIKIVLF